MSTPINALNLDELDELDKLDGLDRVMTSVVQPSPARAPVRGRGQSRLRKLSGSVGAIAVAPLAFVALSALVVMLLAKLVIGLVMVGFDD